ncbi:MAG: ATP-binding cassette domain-containing protein [Acidimicrobiales bacterium]|nr:ATP-binding cassette domain-containing protein [Acidimicrobiales bacterium]
MGDGRPLRAWLNGREFAFDGGQDVRVGRDPTANLLSVNPVVSRDHAVLHPTEGGWVLEDRGSRGGTFLDGHRVTTLPIAGATTVRLGDPDSGDELQLLPEPPPVRLGRLTASYRTDTPRLTIGRAEDNDVVVDDMLVSRYHAELRVSTGPRFEIVDLGSSNGTFVDGNRLDRCEVAETTIIGFGRHQFRLVGGVLQAYEDEGRVEFEAVGLSVMVAEGRPILDAVSFTLPEKSFLAIVGPSGAGKSTLMKALTGFSPADQGTVLYNGRDLYESIEELRSRIGYVPQDDILHPQLTVRRALDFAAELRFPSDVSKEERASVVTAVMEELGLTNRADLPIHKLSGGQRKRTSVALELITKPSLLFLDEPTSGLDPGFEKSAMELLRELADGGRTVIVVTHSLQSLDLCDRVIFLAPGGTTAYFGPPGEALEYFARTDYADVFRELERQQQGSWRERFEESRFYRSYVSGPARRSHDLARGGAEPPPPPAARRSWRGQLGTLVRRNVAVIAADRGLLAMLLFLAPILGVALFAVLGTGGLKPEYAATPGSPRTLVSNAGSMDVLFGLVFCVGLIGTVDSFREIVKELPILRRERSIGLSLSAYLVSKLVVLVPFVVLQATVLTLIAVSRQNGPRTANALGSPVLELVVDVVLTGLGAMVVGLLISASVSTSDKATPLMAAVVAASLLLAGALFDLRDKPVIRELSYLTTTRWGFAAASSSADLTHLADNQCHSPPKASCDANWRHSTSVWLEDLGALGAISVVGLAGTAYALRRRDPHARRRATTAPG